MKVFFMKKFVFNLFVILSILHLLFSICYAKEIIAEFTNIDKPPKQLWIWGKQVNDENGFLKLQEKRCPLAPGRQVKNVRSWQRQEHLRAQAELSNTYSQF